MRTLTKAQAVSELGDGAAASLFRRFRPNATVLVPDTESLSIGDVILTRPTKRHPNKLSQIERHQRTVERLNVEDAPTWSHAMLYVGRLHVAESTLWFKANGKFTSGVRVAPLANVNAEAEYLVRRRTGAAEEYTQAAAMLALTDFALARKGYGFDRIAKMALQELGMLPKILPKFIPTNFRKAMICSEYVLQCFAIGGQILTAEWLALNDHNFFYPADFATHSAFETVPINFKRLTLS